MATTRIYLDTNQWTNCVEPRVAGWTTRGLEDLRAAMRTKLDAGDASFLGSHFHLEEMSRTPDQYRRPIIEFFWSMVRWFVLLPTVELAKLEVAAGRPLEANEPFVTFDHQQRLKQLSRNGQDFDDIGQRVAADNKQAKTAQTQRWARIQVEIPNRVQGMTSEQATKDLWKDPEATLKDWADSYLAKSKKHFGLPDDTALWPDPVKLPTIRAIIVSHLARIYMQLVEHRKILESDEHDSHHYAAASYSDVFVSEDRAFRDTLAQGPRNPVKVITFNDFAVMMGVRPH
jgi:hypothetical protein